MQTSDKKKTYEAPEVTDFGSIEKVTQGVIDQGVGDIPAGAINAVNQVGSGVINTVNDTLPE